MLCPTPYIAKTRFSAANAGFVSAVEAPVATPPLPVLGRARMTLSSADHHRPPLALETTVSDRFARALSAAVRSHEASMRELRAAVWGCAADLKTRGMPPEVALVLMKELVRQTATVAPPPGEAASRRAADLFMEEIVSWCISALYTPAVVRE
jgi:hypothetical protein